MTNMENLWEKSLSQLQANFTPLTDKPEETPERTLISLWQTTCGPPCSVITANKRNCANLSQEQTEKLHDLIAQRISGVPLAHITGMQHFFGIDLQASPSALIPRKETEILAEATLNIIQNRNTTEVTHLDVCTGGGNIPIALALKCRNLTSYAADISSQAIELCKKNIDLYSLQDRVHPKVGDLLTPFDSDQFHKKVDVLTCNPPYISTSKVSEMHSEISQHEPELAFDGGPFGIQILRKLLREAPKFLKPGGWLAFEVGLGQGETIIQRLKTKHNYSLISPIYDSNGYIRTITAQL
ncbi:MAG: release factor glutamine methyltransferase [Desulforhopalus sp.]|jgi:release factor glutamine methyltransferase